jgi:WXG100 family type VII secretion target
MAQFTTDQEAMAAGAVKVDDAAASIQTLLGTLRGDMDTMLGGWKGDASGAFVQVHQAFEGQATKINNALRDMHEALVATGRTYGTQESDQSQSFQGMVGTING